MEAFYTMPDTLCPYYNYAQKRMLCDQLTGTDSKEYAVQPVPNLFGTESVPLEMTDKVLRIQVTEGVEYDWMISPEGIVFVQTLCAPVCSSLVDLYDEQWHFLHAVESGIDAPFVRAHIENGTIVYTDETPLLLDEEEQKHYPAPLTY